MFYIYSAQYKYVSTRSHTHHTYVYPYIECGFDVMNDNCIDIEDKKYITETA